jgi:hypothetical protein
MRKLIMKSIGKRKASKLTFKRHRKHRELPKEERKEMSEEIDANRLKNRFLA